MFWGLKLILAVTSHQEAVILWLGFSWWSRLFWLQLFMFCVYHFMKNRLNWFIYFIFNIRGFCPQGTGLHQHILGLLQLILQLRIL